MRAGLLALAACVLAGLLAAGIWTWAQAERYRADARLLVRPATVRPAVEALAESSLVEANVKQTLRLDSGPEISATRGDGGVLRISAEAGSPERARQVAAEAVIILTQAVERRFSATDATATVLDPAHAAEQTSPTPGRNLLIAGLGGLALGIAAAAALTQTRRRRAPTVVDPALERRLRARIEEVAKRERALARRAGELAKAERDLRLAAERLERAPVPLASPSMPEPEPEPEPEPAVGTGTQVGGWNLRTLETLVRADADASPARREEWTAYLFFLREHADADGALPAQFEPLLSDVFGELVERRAP